MGNYCCSPNKPPGLYNDVDLGIYTGQMKEAMLKRTDS